MRGLAIGVAALIVFAFSACGGSSSPSISEDEAASLVMHKTPAVEATCARHEDADRTFECDVTDVDQHGATIEIIVAETGDDLVVKQCQPEKQPSFGGVGEAVEQAACEGY